MGEGIKLCIYYAFFSNFLCLTFSFKPSSPLNNCMQIFYGTAVASVGGVFNDTRKVKVLSLPETIKEKSTFRAKALRRELGATNSRRRAFARNVDFSFIVSGSEKTFTFRITYMLTMLSSVNRFVIAWSLYANDNYTRKNEQLDQCCQQLVAILCCTFSNNVVLHPVNNCCQQPLFTVVHIQ